MSHTTEIPVTTTTSPGPPPVEVATSSNYLISTVRDNLINAASVENENQVNNFHFHFGWLDYGFFVGLLSISALIGIYYGFFSKHKQNNTAEYILGGRTMKILPVATSLIATLVFQALVHLCARFFFSVFSLSLVISKWWTDSSDKSNYPSHIFSPLSFPVQSYIGSNFGRITHRNLFEWNTVRGYCDCLLSGKTIDRNSPIVFVFRFIFASSNGIFFPEFHTLMYFSFFLQLGLALAYVFLPLYHNLGVTSSFEYLERRFDRRIRLLASFVYTLKYILFIPAVIYVPALVFSQGERKITSNENTQTSNENTTKCHLKRKTMGVAR